MTAGEFQAEFNEWTGEPYNYRLVSVCGYEVGGQERFAAVWEDRPGPDWISHASITEPQFAALRATYAADDLHPVNISGYGVGGQDLYNVIWEHAPGADIVSEVGMSYVDFLAELVNWELQGYEPVHHWRRCVF